MTNTEAEISLPANFRIDTNWRIPLRPANAVSRGWTKATGNAPQGVTWHWTATRDRAACDRLLGGSNAKFKDIASAHYAVGRSFEEGISRYVSLTNRSWHAGKHQKLRWDGTPSTEETKGCACLYWRRNSNNRLCAQECVGQRGLDRGGDTEWPQGAPG